MKLTKSLKIKVGQLSNSKEGKLDTLLKKNTKAINFCLSKAKKGKKITHDLVYKDLRKMNLPATVIHGARNKSIEILKSYLKAKRRLENKKSWKKENRKVKFPVVKTPSVRFDSRMIKLRHTKNKLYPQFVSLLYKAGISGKSDNRIEIPLIVNSNYQKEVIKEIGNNYKLGSTELVKRNNEFYVHISYSKEVEIPKLDSSFSPLGIDVGMNNLVVSVAQSSVKFHSGKRINWKNNFFRKERYRLQQNFAIEEIKRMKGRQSRYNNFYINNIAKSVVEQAKEEEKPVIIMEDLKDIFENTKNSLRKSQKAKHSSWFFNRLQTAIQYKALWEEIPVVYLEPDYTSQICNKCGELNRRDKHTYKCDSCGYECNSDYNAGRNLQRLFLDTFQGEQATINLASNGSISESCEIIKKSAIVRNIDERGG